MMQISLKMRDFWGLKKGGSSRVRPWGFFLVDDDSFQYESPFCIVVPNSEDIKASLLGVIYFKKTIIFRKEKMFYIIYNFVFL